MLNSENDDDDTRSGWWMCNIQHIQLCWISRIHHPKRVMNIIFITLEGDEYHIHHPWGWWISYSSPLSVLKWWMWKYHHCQVPFGGIFITWKVPVKHVFGRFFFLKRALLAFHVRNFSIFGLISRPLFFFHGHFSPFFSRIENLVSRAQI